MLFMSGCYPVIRSEIWRCLEEILLQLLLDPPVGQYNTLKKFLVAIVTGTFIYIVHSNELPFRHLVIELDGKDIPK